VRSQIAAPPVEIIISIIPIKLVAGMVTRGIGPQMFGKVRCLVIALTVSGISIIYAEKVRILKVCVPAYARGVDSTSPSYVVNANSHPNDVALPRGTRYKEWRRNHDSDTLGYVIW